MPRIKGEPKEQVNVKIPAIDRAKIDELVSLGIFSSRSEMINRAISDWFAHEEYKNTISGGVISEISTNPKVIQAIREQVDAYLAAKK